MWDEMESVLLFEINSLRQELLNRAESFLKWYWVTPAKSRSTSSSATQHVPLISKCVDRSVTYETKQRRVKFRRCFGNIPLAGGQCFGNGYQKFRYRTKSAGNVPDSKVHGANMAPTWVLSAPDGPHVGPMNLAIMDTTGTVIPETIQIGK